jgi:hypothetical protein
MYQDIVDFLKMYPCMYRLEMKLNGLQQAECIFAQIEYQFLKVLETHTKLFYLLKEQFFRGNRGGEMCPSAKPSFEKKEEKTAAENRTHTFHPNDTLRCEVSAWNTQNVNNQKKFSR